MLLECVDCEAVMKKNDGREYDVKCKGLGVLLTNERFINIFEEATWICIVFVCHKCVKEVRIMF